MFHFNEPLCFSSLYSCKDVVMEHNHNNITGKTFIKLVFTVVYTGCKLYSLLPTPVLMLSLLSLHLIPVLSPPDYSSVSSLSGCADSSSLQLSSGTAPGKVG